MRNGTGVSRRPGCVILVLLVWATGTWSMQIRVALYDIQALSTGVINYKGSSLKLHQAITLPGTYAIGLQKIAARAAI
jgi:hypothetical protein